MNRLSVWPRQLGPVTLALMLALASLGFISQEVQAASADPDVLVTLDTAAAPSVASDIGAPAVSYQDVNSGGNSGNVIDIGNTYGGSVNVDGGDISNNTTVDNSTTNNVDSAVGVAYYRQYNPYSGQCEVYDVYWNFLYWYWGYC